jgi:hypothetical protein
LLDKFIGAWVGAFIASQKPSITDVAFIAFGDVTADAVHFVLVPVIPIRTIVAHEAVGCIAIREVDDFAPIGRRIAVVDRDERFGRRAGEAVNGNTSFDRALLTVDPVRVAIALHACVRFRVESVPAGTGLADSSLERVVEL